MNNQDLNIILSELTKIEKKNQNHLAELSNLPYQRIYKLCADYVSPQDTKAIGDYAKLEVAAIQVAVDLIDAASTILWHSVYDEKKRKNLCDVLEDLSFKASQAIQQAKDGGNG
jgi:hypothetical protein